MEEYKIEYTREAFADLFNIYGYIQNEYLYKQYAESTIKIIINKINNLSTFPKKHHIIDKEPFKSKEIRLMPEKKYNIYYHIKNNKVIEILRIIYSGKNICLYIVEASKKD